MALCGAIAWGLASALAAGRFALSHAGTIGAVIAIVGITLNRVPKQGFRRAGTTVNPMRPQDSSQLVQSGLHRWSRNPMYLGHAVIVFGVAVLLENAAAFAAVPIYMLYTGHFQIHPEERILQARFGEEYTKYRSRVRRWL